MPNEPERGWFHRVAFQEEQQLATKGQLRQMTVIKIPVTATGIVALSGGSGALNIDGVGLSIEAELGLGKECAIVDSSRTAQVFVRFNSENNDWLPFSLINTLVIGDKRFLLATIGKLWFKVTIIDTDSTPHPYVYFIVWMNAGADSALGGSASSGGYSVPAGASGPIVGLAASGGGGVGGGGGTAGGGGTKSGGFHGGRSTA
jgi:hypothetical protein